MSFDVVVAVFNGVHNNGALLQFLECDQISFDNTQFGGYSKGTFRLRYGLEQSTSLGTQFTTNINSPNRLECFLRNDALGNVATSGANSITVQNPSYFAANQNILVWDGTNYDNVTISSISGSTLTLNQNLAHSYAVNTTVLNLRYTGYISAVNRDAVQDNITTVETSGYQTQLAQRYTSANGGGMECGWVLYQLLNTYSVSGAWDLQVTPSNFVMSTTGAVSGAMGQALGTGQAYNGSQTNASVQSIVQDILLFANANTSNVSYTLWVDEVNQVHFGPINTTTATVSANVVTPTPGYSANAHFNNVATYQLRDEDLTSPLCNVVLVSGGNDGSGNPITAIVQDQLSINTYGQWECTISNPGLYSEAAAEAWGQSYLNITAFPRTQSTTVLDVSGAFATAQDYFALTGFKDGVTRLTNMSTVTTTWTAGDQQFAQQFKGQETFPNVTRLINQIAGQHYIASAALSDGSSNTKDRFVVTGLVPSFSSSTLTVSAGSLCCYVTPTGPQIFSISSFTYTPTSDGVTTVAYLYRTASGTIYTGTGGPQIVEFAGTTIPSGNAYLNYQVVPLFYVYRLGGIITAIDDKRQFGSISLNNLNSEIYSAPTFSSNPSVSSPVVQTSGLTCSIIATAPLANVPQDSGCSQVIWYYRTHGQSTWTIAGESQLAGLPNPAASQTVSFQFFSLSNGASYDFAIAYANLQNAPGTIASPSQWSNIAATSVGIPAQYQLGGVSISPTYSSTSIATLPTINNISSPIALTITISNQPVNGSLSRIAFWRKTAGAGASTYQPYGSIPCSSLTSPSASGTYTFTYPDCVGGQSYDFGCSFENAQGGESTIADAYLNYAAITIQIGTTSLAAMPNAILSAGPTISSITQYAASVAGTVATANTSVTVSDFTSGNVPQWMAGLQVNYRVAFTHSNQTAGAIYSFGISNSLVTSINFGAAQSVDLGFNYVDQTGASSTIVWPSQSFGVSAAALNPVTTVLGTGTGNLVPDGQLAHILTSANEAYWFEYGIDGLSYKVVQGNQYQPFGLFSWTSGANSSSRYANSQPFQLVGGTTYTMSCYLDLINASGSGGARIIGPISGTISNTNPGNAASSVASCIQSGGYSGNPSTVFTPSSTGQYVFQFSNSGITVGGSPIFMACAMVQPGSNFTGFLPSTPVQTDTTTANAGTTAYSSAPVPVQSTIVSTPGSDGSYLGTGLIYNRHITGATQDGLNDGSTYQRMPISNMDSNRRALIDFSQTSHLNKNTTYIAGNIPAKNLIVNGNNCSGTAAALPSAYGWTNPYGGANPGNPASNGNYGSFGSISYGKNAATPQGYYQDVPVTGGSAYTFQCLLYAGSSGMLPTMWIGNAAFSTQYNSTLITTANPNDVLPYYSGVTRYNSAVQTANQSGWYMVYGTFTMPYGATSARVLIYDNTNTNGSFYMLGALLVAGNRIQDYIDHDSNAGSVYLGVQAKNTLPLGQHNASVALDGTGSQVNLVPDSDVKFGNSYWITGGGVFTSSYFGYQGFYYSVPSGGSGGNAGQTNFNLSQYPAGYINVTYPLSYTLSATMQAEANSTVSLILLNAQTNTEIGRITSTGGTSGASYGRVVSSPLSPPSGCSQVYLLAQVTASSAEASTNVLLASQIQLEYGNVATGYKENGANHTAGQFEYGAMSTQVKNSLTSAAGGDGSYLTSGIINNRHFNSTGATLTGIQDDSNYRRLSTSSFQSGNTQLTHTAMSPGVQTGLNSSGQLIGVISTTARANASTFLNNQLSLNGFSGGSFPVTTSTNSSNAATASVSWSAFSLYLTDNSAVSIGAGSLNFTGLVGSTTYYFNVWISTIAGEGYTSYQSGSYYVYGSVSSGAQSYAFIQGMNRDGSVAAIINETAATPLAPASGSNTGGGGGYKPQCPAIHQLVETQEHGFIRADELEVGMHLRDYNAGEWNVIQAVRIRDSYIVDVEIADEVLSVDETHLWLAAGGDPNARSLDWVPTTELSLSTLIAGENGEKFFAVQCIGKRVPGQYVQIKCARNRFMLGQAVSHNIVTE
jgi:hypothetical protein